jgi:2-dehydropantoate 2-reductase
MRIAVFGTGGVGGYFGGRLAQSGEDVTFIARGKHLEAIRQNGLCVKSIEGDFWIRPAQVTDDPRQVGEVDAVLVSVKSWQVPEAALEMKPMIGPETMVVPLENGVQAPEELAAVLGQEHVLGGLCHISSLISEPGCISHVGLKPHIAFGEWNNQRSKRVESLRQAFEKAGIWVEVPENIQVAMWEKFIFIATMSGVGSVTRAPVGVFRSLPETRRLVESSLKEIDALAHARGIPMQAGIVQKTLEFIDGLAPAVMASMERDVLNGQPSELESQNGAVVRMGRQAGVPTPINEFFYASLLPQELKARGRLNL